MTKLGLGPNSPELETILKNKLLFIHYSNMIVEDEKQEMEKFKYLGLLTNPDGYQKIEDVINPKKKVTNQLYKDGKEATKALKKLIGEEQEPSLELG
jgi:hypothetical protein